MKWISSAVAWVCLFVFCVAVWAADGSGAASALHPRDLLAGALAGAVASVVGLFKAVKPDGTREAFNAKSFGTTALIGVVAGGYAKWRGADLAAFDTYFALGAIVYFVDALAKGGIRNAPVAIAGLVKYAMKYVKSPPKPPVPAIPGK